jgi:two-component system, chemotaxis family, protein-glutamate methylesterase/glutaminase
VRVLVIDDSAFMRKIISQMIEETPGMEVIGQARNGREGVEMAVQLKPDLITLDIEMPILDGLGALREIRIKCRAENPAVLMCSSLTTEGSTEAFKALRLGAADVIAKDPATVGKKDADFRDELISKLRAIGGGRRAAPPSPAATTAGSGATVRAAKAPPKDLPKLPSTLDLRTVRAVVIGSSTGGPPILEDILGPLPSGLRVPIFVAQHMPPVFTKTLAARLNQHAACGAQLVTERTTIADNTIYVAEGGWHLHLSRMGQAQPRAEMKHQPEAAVFRPSVDTLFSSAARVYGDGLLAIQLTGMGEDGALGAAEVRSAGGKVIAQHPSTCVVYGMPKAVVESGQADAIMTPAQIAQTLAQLCVQAVNTPEQTQRRSA